MRQIFSTLSFIGIANLDTLFVAAAWGLQSKQISHRAVWLIAGVTSVMTVLSILAGNCTAFHLQPALSNTVSAVLMIGLGIWTLLQGLQVRNEQTPMMQELTTTGDILSLATVLAVNNIGIGVAAGLAGSTPLWAGLFNLAAVLVAVPLGLRIGTHGAQTVLGQRADFVAGWLMIIMGAIVQWI